MSQKCFLSVCRGRKFNKKFVLIQSKKVACKMKTLVLFINLILYVLADREIPCKVTQSINGHTVCEFTSQKFNENEPVNFKAEKLRNSDVKGITFSNSQLKAIPVSLFVSFGNLESFRVRDHDVEILKTRNFENGKKLERLFLSYNKIKKIEKDAFGGLNNLKELEIRKNLIGELDSELFKDMRKLEILDLSSNQLENLQKEIFWTNGDLKKIYLLNNQLTSLNGELFKNNLKLEAIYLEFNRLSNVPNKMFSHLSKLNVLGLLGNQCIDKTYDSITNNFQTIEKELMFCRN